MTDPYSLRPIGVVRSPYSTPAAIPLQGGPARLEVFPAFADGLDGLERSSHLLVLGFLHQADRAALKARPMKVDPQAPAKGVFSTRSPARPNPISLTVVPLLRREGLALEVDRLDLLDGTPLIDLKAYCPGWDSVFCARHEHRAAPGAVDEARLAACLERDLENFLGHSAREPAARWGLAATLVGTSRLGVDHRDPALQVEVNRLDATAEALMALTGATLSNRRLSLQPGAEALRVRFARGERTAELVAGPEPLPDEVARWPAAFAQVGR